MTELKKTNLFNNVNLKLLDIDYNISNTSSHFNNPLYIIFEIFRTKTRGSLCYKEQYFINKVPQNIMVLDLLLFIRNKIDPTLSFRRSCREGICGSCAMNINGKNQLACLTTISSIFKEDNNIISKKKNWSKFFLLDLNVQKKIQLTPHNNYLANTLKASNLHIISIFPLPNLINIRDLIPDLAGFFRQYKEIQPWFNNNIKIGFKSYKQTKQNRKLLDGLYECILCACCSTTCPSYWWNNIDYLGPAMLLQSYRWLVDSRDQDFLNRIKKLRNSTALYKCHQILNCSKVCPKSLNPGKVIKVLQQRIFKGILI